MDINKILRADYLDIIFEGRNKAYGGYELRKKYAKRGRRAGMLVVAGAAILSAIPTLASMMEKPAGNIPRFDTTILVMAPPPVMPKKEIVPPPPPPPAQPDFVPPPTRAFADPRVAPDDQVEKPLQEIQPELQVALKDEDGKGDPSLAIGPGDGGLRGGTGVEDVPAPPPPPMRIVEIPPRFDGELGAWLGSKLRYPEVARERGQEGRSVIEFIVNEDGSIEAARVVQSSKVASLDAEALRVVNAMPKWKPGKQNGKAVRVFFTLPVTFALD